MYPSGILQILWKIPYQYKTGRLQQLNKHFNNINYNSSKLRDVTLRLGDLQRVAQFSKWSIPRCLWKAICMTNSWQISHLCSRKIVERHIRVIEHYFIGGIVVVSFLHFLHCNISIVSILIWIVSSLKKLTRMACLDYLWINC